MSAMVAELVKQSGCRIMVSDEPRVNQADLTYNGTLKDALDKVALAYDYAWRLNKRGVILMTKRFSRPDEYPVLNANEIHQVTQDTLAIFNAFEFPKAGNLSDSICAVYSLLTPEQSAALRAGQRLSVSQLSPPQRQQVQTAVLTSLLTDGYGNWAVSNVLAGSLAGATKASFLRLRREGTSPADASVAPASSTVFEMFEYILVNKHGQEQALLLSGNEVMASDQAAGNAQSAEKKL